MGFNWGFKGLTGATFCTAYDWWEGHIKWMGKTHPATAHGPRVWFLGLDVFVRYWTVHCVPYRLLSARPAISIALYIPVHMLCFLSTFCCVAGSLTGPRPPHYADLERDGHVVRGSFRGYHRGRGRVMHGKLMLAHNSDVVSGCEKQGQPVTCLLFAVCLVHIAI
jgi:hypothetical protein